MNRACVIQFVFIPMLLASIAFAQNDTVFTYQGELTENGSLANDVFAMEFSLWDALNLGNQIGGTENFGSVEVSNGRFTVVLDFGTSAFENSSRWLNIEVNGVPLSPRQPITRTPYSIQTRGIVVNSNMLIGLGTSSPIARLDVSTDTTNAGNNTARFSAPNIGERTSHIHWGVTGDWFIRSADETGKVLIQDNGGSVGIGTAVPTNRLHVVSNVGGAGTAILGQNTTTGFSSATGIRGESTSNLGTGVEGFASATSGSNEGVQGISASTSGSGVVGWATASSGTNFGVYGTSESTSGFDFYAAGAGVDYGTSSSRRWKRNIKNIDDSLYKLSKLRGVYYDWDENHGGHRDIGFIAEEVGAVLPEIVVYEDNDIDAIGMDYSKMTPLLVEAVNALRDETIAAIRAQAATIAQLEAENARLREQHAEMESRFNRLEAVVESRDQ